MDLIAVLPGDLHVWPFFLTLVVNAPSVFIFFVHQENLTEALADLDAALEKELSRQSESTADDEVDASEESDNETNPSKVQELEKQCKTLESELDYVKGNHYIIWFDCLSKFFCSKQSKSSRYYETTKS